MNRRVLVSIANLGAIVVAFVILFAFPQYSNDAFYALIAWMVVGFVLLYAIRPRTPSLPADPSLGSSPFPSNASSTPLASSGSEMSGGIGFCIYCATPVPPGTRACPACGHALPNW